MSMKEKDNAYTTKAYATRGSATKYTNTLSKLTSNKKIDTQV